MNYAHFSVWIVERVEDLVQFGVPRAEAEALLKVLELGALRAEVDARSEDQFLLDFRRLGTAILAARNGVSQQAIRNRRAKLLKSKAPVAPAFAR